VLLRQKIDLLVRRVFGASSEASDVAQLELLMAAPAVAPVVEPPVVQSVPGVSVVRARKDRVPRLPDNLPVVEEVIEPEPVKAQPAAWRCIGQEVSEQLDYEPARFLRRRTIRKKYVHRTEADHAPVIAVLPERLLDRSLPAPGLIAAILVGKYCDHLPLYRQEKIFSQRHQVQLPRQTLARWVALAADWLKPIYETIRTGVMGGGYVQVDETPVNYLEPGNGKTKQGYLWTGHRPGGDVFYRWETSRAAACLDKIIPVDFTGTLQCDGYAAYPSFANGRGEKKIELAGCWAHVRRKFFEAKEQTPRTAGWILRHIQHLYRVEAELREQKAGPQLRVAARVAKPPHRDANQTRVDKAQNQRTLFAAKLVGQRDGLRAQPMADFGSIFQRRSSGDRQQPGGKCHSPHGHRKKELALHRPSRSGRTQRDHLHRHRKLPPPGTQSLRLPQRRVDPPAEHD